MELESDEQQSSVI